MNGFARSQQYKNIETLCSAEEHVVAATLHPDWKMKRVCAARLAHGVYIFTSLFFIQKGLLVMNSYRPCYRVNSVSIHTSIRPIAPLSPKLNSFNCIPVRRTPCLLKAIAIVICYSGQLRRLPTSLMLQSLLSLCADTLNWLGQRESTRDSLSRDSLRIVLITRV